MNEEDKMNQAENDHIRSLAQDDMAQLLVQSIGVPDGWTYQSITGDTIFIKGSEIPQGEFNHTFKPLYLHPAQPKDETTERCTFDEFVSTLVWPESFYANSQPEFMRKVWQAARAAKGDGK